MIGVKHRALDRNILVEIGLVVLVGWPPRTNPDRGVRQTVEESGHSRWDGRGGAGHGPGCGRS